MNLFARAASWMAVSKPLPDAVKRGYLAPYDGWGNRIAVHRFVQDIPLQPGHPSYQTLADIEQSLPQFRERPMLLVWGMRDWCFTPWYLEEWVRRFPDADVRRIDAASHYVFEDAPEEVLSAVREFLAAREH